MQQLYSKLSAYYDDIIKTSVNTELEVRFISQVCKSAGVHSILDLGCGTGRHSIALGQQGFRVLGIDYAPRLLEIARAKAGTSNVQFILQDVATMEITESYDAAICMWSTFAELPYKKMLIRLKSILKPGGLLLIDSRYFSEKNVVRTNNYSGEILLGDDGKLNVHIKEIIHDHTRDREVTYEKDGRILKDYISIDTLTEHDLIEIMKEAGFESVGVFYDYGQFSGKDINRMQLVFINRNYV